LKPPGMALRPRLSGVQAFSTEFCAASQNLIQCSGVLLKRTDASLLSLAEAAFATVTSYPFVNRTDPYIWLVARASALRLEIRLAVPGRRCCCFMQRGRSRPPWAGNRITRAGTAGATGREGL
jgi:hypothetical protein